MINIVTRIFAVSVTLIVLAMSGVAASDRGGTSADQAIMIALSVIVCAGSQLILALSRRWSAWLLWGFCLLGTIYSHVTFITYASVRAGHIRTLNSDQMQNLDRQYKAVKETLDNIYARPVAVVAAELFNTNGWRKRQELQLELKEANRAAKLRDELVTISHTASLPQVTGVTDPVTFRIAKVTGLNDDQVMLLTSLFFSVLLELIGAFLWIEVMRCHNDTQKLDGGSDAGDIVRGLKSAIAAGGMKPTVRGIRSHLGCSQAQALELRRAIQT